MLVFCCWGSLGSAHSVMAFIHALWPVCSFRTLSSFTIFLAALCNISERRLHIACFAIIQSSIGAVPLPKQHTLAMRQWCSRMQCFVFSPAMKALLRISISFCISVSLLQLLRHCSVASHVAYRRCLLKAGLPAYWRHCFGHLDYNSAAFVSAWGGAGALITCFVICILPLRMVLLQTNCALASHTGVILLVV